MYFVGYLYIMDLINARKKEHIKTEKKKNIWPCERKWRIGDRENQELMDRYREPDIISEIRERRLRWCGHMERLARRRITVKNCLRITRNENKSRFQSQVRDGWAMLNMI